MQITCPNCQTIHTDGEIFCKTCGSFLPPAPVHNPEQMRETMSDANGLLLTLYYIVAAAMPIAGILLGAIMIFAGRDEKTKRRGRGLTIFAVIFLLIHVLLMQLLPFFSIWLNF